MLNVVLVSGPPFDTALWAHVEDRLTHHNVRPICWAMFEGEATDFDSETGRLVDTLHRIDGPIILAGHGLANPLVMAAAHNVKLTGLALSNGPIRGPDRLTKAARLLSRSPRGFAISFLRSSLGLRRLVVNPYVMDHDTTVAVCGPIFEEPARRKKMRKYLQTVHWSPPPAGLKTLLCRAETDHLSCYKDLSFIDDKQNNLTVDIVLGARPLHPLERPWEFADRLVNWCEKLPIAT